MKSMMIAVALVAMLASSALAHMCLFHPSMRPDADGVLTQAEYDNSGLAPLAKCKRNVNVGPYEVRGSAASGTVCGGNANAAWNTAITPPASNVWEAGTTVTLKTLVNRPHPAVNDTRGGFVVFDYAPIANPTSHDDFITIGLVAAGDENNAKATFDWTIPSDLRVEHGTFRAVLSTGYADTSADPSVGGISSTYSSCGDFSVVERSDSGAVLVSSLVGLVL